jgi:hypothetical protein
LTVDTTYNVFQHIKKSKIDKDGNIDNSKWYLCNVAGQSESKAFALARVIINGQSEAHFNLGYKLLFSSMDDTVEKLSQAAKDALQNRSVSATISAIMTDFQRAEINGLRDQLTEQLGQEAGLARFDELVKLCAVHWMRLVRKRSSDYPPAKLFRLIGFAICTTTSVDQAKRGLRLLATVGTITRQDLVGIGIPPVSIDSVLPPGDAGGQAVSWGKNERWIALYLSAENSHMLAGLCKEAAKAVGWNDSNIGEAINGAAEIRELKELVNNSAHKTHANVFRVLFEHERKEASAQVYVSSGGRLDHRAPAKDAAQRNAAENYQFNSHINVDDESKGGAALVAPIGHYVCSCKTRCLGAQRCGCNAEQTKSGVAGATTRCSHKCRCICNTAEEQGNAPAASVAPPASKGDAPGQQKKRDAESEREPGITQPSDTSKKARGMSNKQCACTKGCKGQCSCKKQNQPCNPKCSCNCPGKATAAPVAAAAAAPAPPAPAKAAPAPAAGALHGLAPAGSSAAVTDAEGNTASSGTLRMKLPVGFQLNPAQQQRLAAAVAEAAEVAALRSQRPQAMQTVDATKEARKRESDDGSESAVDLATIGFEFMKGVDDAAKQSTCAGCGQLDDVDMMITCDHGGTSKAKSCGRTFHFTCVDLGTEAGRWICDVCAGRTSMGPRSKRQHREEDE